MGLLRAETLVKAPHAYKSNNFAKKCKAIGREHFLIEIESIFKSIFEDFLRESNKDKIVMIFKARNIIINFAIIVVFKVSDHEKQSKIKE